MNTAGKSLLKKQWPVVPLGSIVKQVSVGIPMSRYAAKEGEEAASVPVLSVGNIEDDCIARADLIPRARLRVGDFDRFRVHEGDVLVSARGTILKVALVLHGSAGVFASSNIIVIRPDQSRILPQVILALLRAPLWQEILKSRTRSSTGLMQLTAKDVASLPIPVPAIKIQEKIALLVEHEERAYRSAIDAASRRRSLVNALLTSA
jgi:restriction endonuclease S subunit